MASKARRRDGVAVTINRRRGLRRALRLGALATVLLLVAQWLLAGSTFEAALSTLPQRVLVVTAHPDDEVMFFAPAILSLRALGVEVHALCLSIGNADGLGSIRRQELVQSYGVLGVPAHRVQSIDDEQLQDGMDVRWSPEHIRKYIEAQSVGSGPFDVILTFDQHGISGHANHAACYASVADLISGGAGHVSQRAFALRSVSVAQKFFGLPHSLLRHITAQTPGSAAESPSISTLSTPRQYLQSLHAMRQHRSQLVWFRYLYVVFSTYMYGATLDEISPISAPSMKQPMR